MAVGLSKVHIAKVYATGDRDNTDNRCNPQVPGALDSDPDLCHSGGDSSHQNQLDRSCGIFVCSFCRVVPCL